MNFRQLQTLRGDRAASGVLRRQREKAQRDAIDRFGEDPGTRAGSQAYLFDRSQRKATVTAKGRELVGYAERALLLQDEIRQQIGPREGLSGLVRVGVAELVAMTWLPKLAKVLHERYPKITLELDIALTSPLKARLQSGELDVALIPGTAFDPGYVALPLGSVKFCWRPVRTSRCRIGLSCRRILRPSGSCHSVSTRIILTRCPPGSRGTGPLHRGRICATV